MADATGELVRQRYDLVVGAAQPQADLDRVSGIVEADEDASDEVLAELKAGPGRVGPRKSSSTWRAVLVPRVLLE